MSAPSSTPARVGSYATVGRNPRFLVLWIDRMSSFSGDVVFNLAAIWFVLTTT